MSLWSIDGEYRELSFDVYQHEESCLWRAGYRLASVRTHVRKDFKTIHTTMSPTRPYSSHRTSSSRSQTSNSVWSCDRCPPQWSHWPRTLRFAVHLIKCLVTCKKKKYIEYALWTPSLHNTSKESLFRIVCNIRCKTVDCTLKVIVWEVYDFRHSHCWFK
jgi:hypothetical protein